MDIKKVGLALKPGIHNSEAVGKIINYLLSRNIHVYVDPGSDVEISYGERKLVKDMSDINLLITLGGDGTLIYAARNLKVDVPVLTVNFGGRGFLATLEPKEFFFAMESLLKDNYFIEERTRLNVFLNNEKIGLILNEALLISCPISKLILELCINNERFKLGRVDGIIVSTFTGSTAHAFSAGGPIITPDLDVIEIIPLNPLNPAIREIITGTKATVIVRVKENTRSAHLVLDGSDYFEIGVGDEILLKNSNKPIRLVKFRHIRFLERVYDKLLKVD